METKPPEHLLAGHTLTFTGEAAPGGPGGDDAAFVPTWTVTGSAGEVHGGAGTDLPGDQLAGRFVIERALGEGGMGVVYLAHDARLERKVAIKVLRRERLRADGSAGQARLLREARAMAKLSHPNVVTVHELGALGQELFLAMEYVENGTLRAWQAKDRDWRELVDAYLQAGQGLAAAHRAGLVHRDFKPENVLIGPDGRPRVSDFGLVSASQAEPRSGAAEASSSPSLTRTGSALGTPAYMAPEQHRRGPVDARADQFSFCVALFEALYRQRPFAGEEYSELVEQVLAGHVRTPANRRGVPPALHEVLLRGLSVDPARRFASMDELLAAIEAATPPATRPARPARLALVGAGLAGLGIAWVSTRHAPVGPAVAPAALPPAQEKAAPAAAPPTPRQLTHLDGCVYMPAFADDGAVVFDLTRDREQHLWSVPLAGGEPTQLTRGGLTEWRAMPGRRPGEVVYIIDDPGSNRGEKAGFASLDLASGRSESLSRQDAASAGYIGGVLHYITRGGNELHRVRDGVDEVALSFPPGVHANLFTVSHDGKRIAIMAKAPGTPRVCVTDPVDQHFECLAPRRMGPGHPAFSLDDTSVYYPGTEGIGRVGLDGKDDTLVVPGVYALGGIALSREGAHLVYSDCSARGLLVDVDQDPPLVLSKPGRLGDVAAGPAGSLAYVVSADSGYGLMLRAADGTNRQIVGPTDERISNPRFSPDGSQIAFGLGGDGIHTVQIRAGEQSTIVKVTSDESDDTPLWLGDGRLAFTRTSGEAGVYVVDLEGGTPALVAPLRRAIGNLPGGKLLVMSPDANRFYEWDPASRRVTPSRVAIGKPGILSGASTSLDGRWLVVRGGPMGLRLYRYDLSKASPEPELVHAVEDGDTLSAPAIDANGHVFIAPLHWSGELYALDAAPGTHF